MNILDPGFKYVPSAQTDIRKTIRREQKRLEAEKSARELAARQAGEEQKRRDAETAKVVTTIRAGRK